MHRGRERDGERKRGREVVFFSVFFFFLGGGGGGGGWGGGARKEEIAKNERDRQIDR